MVMDCLATREIHSLLLDMLYEFDCMCETHGIRYSLDCGTLLGAVRHKGFIPWDDDVDVMVPRPDYERLVANSGWAPKGYRMGPYMNGRDGVKVPFMKFCNLAYRAQEPALAGVVDECLWIDVFPGDAVPDGDEAAIALVREQVRLINRANRRVLNVEATRGWVKREVKRLVKPLLKLAAPPERLYERVVENATRYEFGSTSRVANISWFGNPRPRWCPAHGFDDLTELPFEGKRFKAVSCWDEYLRMLYGDDYMELPPIEQRVTHGTRVWKA